jgi:hypothetical protein
MMLALGGEFATPDASLLEEAMHALGRSSRPSKISRLAMVIPDIDVATLFLAMSRHFPKLEQLVLFLSVFSQVCYHNS